MTSGSVGGWVAWGAKKGKVREEMYINMFACPMSRQGARTYDHRYFKLIRRFDTQRSVTPNTKNGTEISATRRHRKVARGSATSHVSSCPCISAGRFSVPHGGTFFGAAFRATFSSFPQAVQQDFVRFGTHRAARKDTPTGEERGQGRVWQGGEFRMVRGWVR